MKLHFKCDNCGHNYTINMEDEISLPICPYCKHFFRMDSIFKPPLRGRFNRGDVVTHFKGRMYEIIYPRAKCCTNGKEGYVVIYKSFGDTKDNSIFVRDYDEFMSKVDFKKYPNSEQEYRFEFCFNVDDRGDS